MPEPPPPTPAPHTTREATPHVAGAGYGVSRLATAAVAPRARRYTTGIVHVRRTRARVRDVDQPVCAEAGR